MPPSNLRFGPLGADCVHLCIDMQNLFAEATDWHTPWMARVLPRVADLVRHRPDRTVFTRFVPPHHADRVRGAWRRYYERWPDMIGERLDPRLLELLPALREAAPDAPVFDKDTYSPWVSPDLDAALSRRGVTTLVISGTETDVCVLGAVLGAVDRGYRVVLPVDAVCSSADETHEALLTLYRCRFGQQIETADTQEVLAAWPLQGEAEAARSGRDGAQPRSRAGALR